LEEIKVRKRSIALCGCALAVVLLASGCGGGGGGSEEVETSSIGKAEFIKQADAACSKGEKQMQTDFVAYIKEHEKELEGEPTQSEARFADLVDTVMIPEVKGEIEQIRTIGAPGAEQSEVEAIVAALEEGIENVEEDPKAAVQHTGEAFTQAHKLATEYGLKVCVLG
jgi:hypothetical protein